MRSGPDAAVLIFGVLFVCIGFAISVGIATVAAVVVGSTIAGLGGLMVGSSL